MGPGPDAIQWMRFGWGRHVVLSVAAHVASAPQRSRHHVIRHQPYLPCPLQVAHTDGPLSPCPFLFLLLVLFPCRMPWFSIKPSFLFMETPILSETVFCVYIPFCVLRRQCRHVLLIEFFVVSLVWWSRDAFSVPASCWISSSHFYSHDSNATGCVLKLILYWHFLLSHNIFSKDSV